MKKVKYKNWSVLNVTVKWPKKDYATGAEKGCIPKVAHNGLRLCGFTATADG